MYLATFKLISKNMYKKSPENFSLAGSSTNAPFRVFLSARGPKIAQPCQKSVGVKTLTIQACVPNMRHLYDFVPLNADK